MSAPAARACAAHAWVRTFVCLAVAMLHGHTAAADEPLGAREVQVNPHGGLMRRQDAARVEEGGLTWASISPHGSLEGPELSLLADKDALDPGTAALDQAATPVKYWIDDGCHSSEVEKDKPDDVEGYYEDPSAARANGGRCCSQDGAACTTTVKCNKRTKWTFAQAEQHCEKQGKRLCTKAELLSDMCCSTGGNCDSFAVWTSTPQPPPSTTALPGQRALTTAAPASVPALATTSSAVQGGAPTPPVSLGSQAQPTPSVVPPSATTAPPANTTAIASASTSVAPMSLTAANASAPAPAAQAASAPSATTTAAGSASTPVAPTGLTNANVSAPATATQDALAPSATTTAAASASMSVAPTGLTTANVSAPAPAAQATLSPSATPQPTPAQSASANASATTVSAGAPTSATTSLVTTPGPASVSATVAGGAVASTGSTASTSSTASMAATASTTAAASAASASAAAANVTSAATPATPAAAATNATNASAVVSTSLIAPAAAGATTLQVASKEGFAVGDAVNISGGGNSEIRSIAGLGSIVLDKAVNFSYPAGSVVTKQVNATNSTNGTWQFFDVMQSSSTVWSILIGGGAVVVFLACVFGVLRLGRSGEAGSEAGTPLQGARSGGGYRSQRATQSAEGTAAEPAATSPAAEDAARPSGTRSGYGARRAQGTQGASRQEGEASF